MSAGSAKLRLSPQMVDVTFGPIAASVGTMGTPGNRLRALDGLRAMSILLVLAAHLLPLGGALNTAAGLMGMALFFALSGFLIVRFLAEGMPLTSFGARRAARIVPLAWITMVVLWLAAGGGPLAANLLFIANLPPAALFHGGEHLWSLCIEVQFYAAVTVLCWSPRRWGLYLVPALALAVTALRIFDQQPYSIVTWHRVDEILAGGTVALVYCGWFGQRPKRTLERLPFPLALVILLGCSLPASGPLLYLRPYASALVLASVVGGVQGWSRRLLVNRPTAYIAEISYALYVIHGMLAASWLGTGDLLEKYLKRPALLAATFALAHLSTFYLERPLTKLARRMEPAGPPSCAPRVIASRAEPTVTRPDGAPERGAG